MTEERQAIISYLRSVAENYSGFGFEAEDSQVREAVNHVLTVCASNIEEMHPDTVSPLSKVEVFGKILDRYLCGSCEIEQADRLVSVSKCKKHPKYKALRKPKSCRDCWVIWNRKRVA